MVAWAASNEKPYTEHVLRNKALEWVYQVARIALPDFLNSAYSSASSLAFGPVKIAWRYVLPSVVKTCQSLEQPNRITSIIDFKNQFSHTGDLVIFP